MVVIEFQARLSRRIVWAEHWLSTPTPFIPQPLSGNAGAEKTSLTPDSLYREEKLFSP